MKVRCRAYRADVNCARGGNIGFTKRELSHPHRAAAEFVIGNESEECAVNVRRDLIESFRGAIGRSISWLSRKDRQTIDVRRAGGARG